MSVKRLRSKIGAVPPGWAGPLSQPRDPGLHSAFELLGNLRSPKDTPTVADIMLSIAVSALALTIRDSSATPALRLRGGGKRHAKIATQRATRNALRARSFERLITNKNAHRARPARSRPGATY